MIYGKCSPRASFMMPLLAGIALCSFCTLIPQAFSTDWIALGQDSYWSDNLEQPLCKNLAELSRKDRHSFENCAFTPNGDWVVLVGGNGFYTSNLSLPACKKMLELQKDHTFKCVAFTGTGGWAILMEGNAFWAENVPQDSFDKLKELAAKNHDSKWISYSPSGAWILKYDENGIAHSGLGADLRRVLDAAVAEHDPVHCAAFDSSGDAFVLTKKRLWSSAPELTTAKEIDRLVKSGNTLQWLAFAPDDPATLRYRLETKPSQRVKATLAVDYFHPDDKIRRWDIYAPHPPTLPNQQVSRTTFVPAGRVVKESGPRQRPLFLTTLVDGRKEIHALLTVEATLFSRNLRPLAAHETAPEVPPLSAEQQREFTQNSHTLELDSPAFIAWENAAGLKRKPAEADLAYAHRALSYIKHHFTYKWPNDTDTVPKVCAAGKSDCGGLSYLFIALMRRNGVPARGLGGRWAASQKPGDTSLFNGQYHMKSEFFAKGVGWIPVDASGAVTDTSGSEYAHLGHDPGDFIALGEDIDFRIDSFHGKVETIGVLQNLLDWWSGDGDGKNSSTKALWTVTKEAQ